MTDSVSAAASLRDGLERGCADDISEALCNLADGTCDAVELIPWLEQVAARDHFRYFDDNGAGGMPHPTGEARSFRDWARAAIENIRANGTFVSPSPIAVSLKSLDTDVIANALRQLASGDSHDETLLPILDKIAKKDTYDAYSYFSGDVLPPACLGGAARGAIQRIRENVAAAATRSLKCEFCGNIPGRVSVNTGREQYFEAPITLLKRHGIDRDDDLWECPQCTALFHWHNDSSWTGSGNDDAETLTRLSANQTLLFRDSPAEFRRYVISRSSVQ